MSAPKLLLSVLTASILSLTLGACGSDGDKVKKEYDRVEEQVRDEYDRVEDKVKKKYEEVEDKLSDDEKSMAEIFLPPVRMDHYRDPTPLPSFAKPALRKAQRYCIRCRVCVLLIRRVGCSYEP